MFRSPRGPLGDLLSRPEPTWWLRFCTSPLETIAQTIYHLRHPVSRQHPSPIKIICISDTHTSQPKIPDGHVLVHAGDLSHCGSIGEIQPQLDWLKLQPHHYKIFIAGNHDRALESRERDKLDWNGLIYLQDSTVTIRIPNGRTLNIYGSPWTREHGNWAFQYPAAKDFWSGKIPQEVDVLITHMPPRFHLDIDGWGDEGLLKELWRTRPALHVFGHFHAGHGCDLLTYDDFESSYAGIRRRTEGWMAVLGMAWRLLTFKLGEGSVVGTQLVNASIVGGLRDNLVRDPIEILV
ncbi:MAG: hypothetical protein Q9187_006521 [Circinaria calcarea]